MKGQRLKKMSPAEAQRRKEKKLRSFIVFSHGSESSREHSERAREKKDISHRDHREKKFGVRISKSETNSKFKYAKWPLSAIFTSLSPLSLQLSALSYLYASPFEL